MTRATFEKLAGVSERDSERIEMLRNVVIKPRWASDEFARTTAVDVIAAYGASVIPVLAEINERADSRMVQQRAAEWLTKLRA
jgi:hypothetical protein